MKQSHQGSALILSLIFLLVITVGALSAMKISTIDERMTANYRDRQVMFQTAETALTQVEDVVQNTAFQVDKTYDSCSGSGCYTSNCTSGLCRSTNFTSSSNCQLRSDTPWKTDANWETASRHGSVTVRVDNVNITAKYLVEFRCFVPKTSGSPLDPVDKNNGDPLYRITVLAERASTGAKVMLQSTFKQI